MYLEIVTPEKNLYSGDADLIQVPGVLGSFEILKNHAPIISTLNAGRVKVRYEGKESFFDIKGGLIECHDNNIIVLAD